MIDRKVVGGSLIVAGTAIGAGMLALPVATAEGGFFPACMIFLLCWLFSTATGLLFVELINWMPQDSNIITMARRLLGRPGKVIAWALYIFLFYSLTVAYVSSGGNFVSSVIGEGTPKALGIIIFTVVFGGVVYFGTKWVDRINSVLMLGLVITFVAFVIMGAFEVDPTRLLPQKWGRAFLALPVMFTSFSFQGTIPSLYTYLDHDPYKTRKAIIIGAAIPFLAYIVWEVLILGIIPQEALFEAKRLDLTAVAPLRDVLSSKTIIYIGAFFAFFALTTSFLGVTLGLLDFLSDGLQIEKKGWGKGGLCALVYVPPMIIGVTTPTLFFRALGYGGIGCALLLGLLPTLMVWVGRYKENYPKHDFRLPGGRKVLLLLFAFVALELTVEVINECLSLS